MKKLVLFFAAAAMAVSASAQVTVEGSKFTDNWYIGVQGGVSTKTTGKNRWVHNLNPNAGLRIGKNITPIFGLVAEGNAYFGWRAQNNLYLKNDGQLHHNALHTFVKASNVNLLANINLVNLFAGYKGEPRPFEVNALYGFGWLHEFGTKDDMLIGNQYSREHLNFMTSKAALDFAYNFGSAKQFQLFIEPSINWVLNGSYINGGRNGVKYDIRNSWVQLNAGFIYKFKTSNGTHNFKIAEGRDQAEIDELNRIINDLRNRKPETVVKEVVKEVQVGKEVRVDDLVFVTFAQGKSNLTPEAKKALDNIKEGRHVQIVGTASTEGSAEVNQRISQGRADAVAEYLKARGVIVDEAIGKGVQGSTSNRIAVVYVK